MLTGHERIFNALRHWTQTDCNFLSRQGLGERKAPSGCSALRSLIVRYQGNSSR